MSSGWKSKQSQLLYQQWEDVHVGVRVHTIVRIRMSSAVTRLVLASALLLAGCAAKSSLFTPIEGDVERGAQLFAQGQDSTPPCSTCHRVVNDQVGFSIGPNLAGIAERAGAQVAGLTAEGYLRQSIIEPHRYVVSGYRNIMYPGYSAHLSEQDTRDLIAYLLTL